ncbi:MAG: ATP-binding protein, partial [Anaerovoracaceae bacterium]
EYPIIAIKEILMNALIHRDYSINTENSPIRILMFSDRIEIENPGGLYGRITVDDLGKVGADTRNPYIASNLEIMIDTENRFSGIPTIRNEMEKAGLSPPKFESSSGVFKVTLYNDRFNLNAESPESRVLESSSVFYHVNDNQKENVQRKEIYRDEQSLIDYCKIARSRKELADFIGLKSSAYVMEIYIQPLLESEKLRMTIPEKPKSKRQLYVAVART